MYRTYVYFFILDNIIYHILVIIYNVFFLLLL